VLADTAEHKKTLGPAAQRWAQQFAKTRPPLEIRLAPAKTLHDRLIIKLAERAPTSLVRADPETGALKISAMARCGRQRRLSSPSREPPHFCASLAFEYHSDLAAAAAWTPQPLREARQREAATACAHQRFHVYLGGSRVPKPIRRGRYASSSALPLAAQATSGKVLPTRGVFISALRTPSDSARGRRPRLNPHCCQQQSFSTRHEVSR
jgi:hypothetical protein